MRLFDAPDLASLQRNWPRIALRGSVLVLIPLLVTLLARSLELYPAIRSLPLPLEFLDVGPFAYEGKIIFALVATLLSLAFLIPKRTPQLVIAVCVAGVLWTGHVFISLQWARLFATQFNFRRETAPEPVAWIYATLLLTVGVLFLLVESLLETRAQQDERKLAKEETRAAFEVAFATLGYLLALGAALGAVLVGGYLLIRRSLADASLPFRLNPVFILFGMGVGLAVLVALAARKRAPTEWVSRAPTAAVAGPAAPSASRQQQAPAATDAIRAGGFWARMTRPERTAFVTAAVALGNLVLPWTSSAYSYYARDGPGLETSSAIPVLIAGVATLVAMPRRKRGRFSRVLPPLAWMAVLLSFIGLARRANTGVLTLKVGAFLGFGLALLALVAGIFAARRALAPVDEPN